MFVIIITVCSNTYLFDLIICICVSLSYDLNYTYAHRAIARVFSRSLPLTTSPCTSLHVTFPLIPIACRHIEGVSQGTVNTIWHACYSCEITANNVEGNLQPPLWRPIAPRSLGHLPDAMSQSKELPTRRSLTSLSKKYRRLTSCNPRHLICGRELTPHQPLHQALQRSPNLTLTLSRFCRKIQISIPCRILTHNTQTAPGPESHICAFVST